MKRTHSGVIVPEHITEEATVELAQLIRVEYPDELPIVVGLPISGLRIAEILSRNLGIGASSVVIAGVEKVKGKNGAPTSFKHGQMPTEASVAGKDVLVVDGVARSGEKIGHVVNYVQDLGAKSVEAAVLFLERHKLPSIYTPTHVVERNLNLGYPTFHWEQAAYIAATAAEEAALIADVAAVIEANAEERAAFDAAAV